MTIVYRVLHEDECLTWSTVGLVAKDPLSMVTLTQHLADGSKPPYRKSKFISTCKSLPAALKVAAKSYFENKVIVAINCDMPPYVMEMIIDISTETNAKHWLLCPDSPSISEQEQRAIRFAVWAEEMVILGAVPADCISLIVYRMLGENAFVAWNTFRLVAPNPFANITVAQLVSQGRLLDHESPYIITYKHINIARKYHAESVGKNFIVAIDLAMAKQVSTIEIIDLSTHDNAVKHIHDPALGRLPRAYSGYEQAAIKNAVMFQQVLIKGDIPSSCMTLVEK